MTNDDDDMMMMVEKMMMIKMIKMDVKMKNLLLSFLAFFVEMCLEKQEKNNFFLPGSFT